MERMSIYKTGDKSLYNITVCQEDRNDVMVLGFNLGHTRESVQSPLVVLRLSAKRRRLFLWQIRL